MSTSAHARGRVLVVGDKPGESALYAGPLQDAGFEVEACEGVDALRRIASDDFDLVIDATKRHAEAFELLRLIRASSLSAKVVLVLASRSNQIALQAAELGALQSFVKPIEPGVIARVATLAVSLRRTLRGQISSEDYRAGWGERVSVSATVAKNEFGRVLDAAIQGGAVFITKHQAPKAVLVSMEEFRSLSRVPEVKLEKLSREFDAMLARMQTPRARAAMQAAFDASPEQLGNAAVAAARQRG